MYTFSLSRMCVCVCACVCKAFCCLEINGSVYRVHACNCLCAWHFTEASPWVQLESNHQVFSLLNDNINYWSSCDVYWTFLRSWVMNHSFTIHRCRHVIVTIARNDMVFQTKQTVGLQSCRSSRDVGWMTSISVFRVSNICRCLVGLYLSHAKSNKLCFTVLFLVFILFYLSSLPTRKSLHKSGNS